MPLKASGRAGEPRAVDRFEGGVGWIAHPGELIARASHAVEGDDGVWLVDPLDAEGVDGLLADLGEVAGVVVLFGHHGRDAGELARRHGVPVHVPEWMGRIDVDAPVERFAGELGGSGYELRAVVDAPFWTDGALYDGETLIVGEAVGTAEHFVAPGERLGVHPLLRVVPPRRALGGVAPDRVLVGHGAGVHEDAAGALRDALRGARRRLPALYAKNLRRLLPV